MDKLKAIKLSTRYLKRLRANDIKFSEAWIFGSYTIGAQHNNSDIDIAIVLDNSTELNFETEVKLMIIRDGEETMIEPHAFTKEEFSNNTQLINQIRKGGVRIPF